MVLTAHGIRRTQCIALAVCGVCTRHTHHTSIKFRQPPPRLEGSRRQSRDSDDDERIERVASGADDVLASERQPAPSSPTATINSRPLSFRHAWRTTDGRDKAERSGFWVGGLQSVHAQLLLFTQHCDARSTLSVYQSALQHSSARAPALERAPARTAGVVVCGIVM